MHRSRTVLAQILVLFFLGLSFNAYACLIPLFTQSHAAMASGCSAPDDQPVHQFCDVFKTLGVKASPKLYSTIDCQTLCPEDTASPSPFLGSGNRCLIAAHPADGLPRDLLSHSCVLRL